MAFTFILGPSEFQQLAQADTLYQNLSTSGWGQTDRTIDYTYDANGSLLSKTTRETSTSTVQERVDYQYNYQGRLSRVITDLDSASGTNPVDVVDYAYNEAGIRVSAYSFTVAQNYLDTQDEQTYATNKHTTLYLIDAQNPTGYAQVIAELNYNKSNPNPATDTPTSIRSYTIGDDMLAQTDDPLGTPALKYLLYDGQGSTRQLVNASQTIQGSYSYDAYGMMLGGNPTAAAPAATNLLYTGEQYDANLQQYYLRARYYNPSNGRFNQLDPFAGNNSDPQSLHKYAYCHANPVNGIDPTGELLGGISGLTLSIAIGAILTNIGLTVYSGIRHGQSGLGIAWSVIQNLATFVAIAGAILLSGPIALVAALSLIVVSIVGIINLIRSWPKMDTTDKVVTAATMLTFIVFVGAIKAGASPTPEPAPQISGEVSVLPESYFSHVAVDMRNAPPGSQTNAAGFPRNGPWFWRQVRSRKPEYFSTDNLQ